SGVGPHGVRVTAPGRLSDGRHECRSSLSPLHPPRARAARTAVKPCTSREARVVNGRMSVTATIRRMILRANAVWLLLGSVGGLIGDVSGAFFARGPESAVLAGAPGAAIGFVEAHGLALVMAVLLWLAPSRRSWHLTGLAVHLLLGTANLVFWQVFAS